MCYNCGCGMPNNDMGHPENITNQKFEAAAKAMGNSLWRKPGKTPTIY